LVSEKVVVKSLGRADAVRASRGVGREDRRDGDAAAIRDDAGGGLPFVNVPEAPLDGAVNVTPAPLIGLLPHRARWPEAAGEGVADGRGLRLPAVAEIEAVAGPREECRPGAGKIW